MRRQHPKIGLQFICFRDSPYRPCLTGDLAEVFLSDIQRDGADTEKEKKQMGDVMKLKTSYKKMFENFLYQYF